MSCYLHICIVPYQACWLHLDPPMCGPYLRSSRWPTEQHKPACGAGLPDCPDGRVCTPTLRGRECATWRQILDEMFWLGEQITVCTALLSKTSWDSFQAAVLVFHQVEIVGNFIVVVSMFDWAVAPAMTNTRKSPSLSANRNRNRYCYR